MKEWCGIERSKYDDERHKTNALVLSLFSSMVVRVWKCERRAICLFGYCLMLGLRAARTHGQTADTHTHFGRRTQNAFISTSVNIILIQFVCRLFRFDIITRTLCRSMSRNISFWALSKRNRQILIVPERASSNNFLPIK